ncbi:hypothetical protein M422DRAFT_51590 [Sphaerobolus stellatus SS14]|uniref:Uncharacterized protein n=1 Tax=Sphaerobolus stellatus (strain SS14) TaxID=990650 RepID=A0A0C9UJX8_SPHS4|nr:hypothetical protein M422DRAFT_51590 [Sphaerobolus stellatus SS14]
MAREEQNNPPQDDMDTGTHQHLGLDLPGAHPPPRHHRASEQPNGPPGALQIGDRQQTAEPGDAGDLLRENEALKAQIAALQVQHRQLNERPRPYVSDQDFEDLSSWARTLREQEEPKTMIPDMIPGYRASTLSHGESISI